MTNLHNIQSGDEVKLIEPFEAIEPAINDGQTIKLEAGWSRPFIRFSEDGRDALLWYMRNPDVVIPIPVDLLVRVHKK